MAIVNIGILAHVDAGKTSLTERILYETGVIKAVGSVDKGTTQTDTLELERARGITIKSAVVSFHLNQLKVNLIDTPGHGDFVAEVERSLRVLDGVVLVVSAVEGVQSQTRRLARAIRAAGLPLLVFVNKIDRMGARPEAVLDEIQRKLRLRVVAMDAAVDVGDRAASVACCNRDDPSWRGRAIDILAETDERVIEEFERTGGEPSRCFLDDALRSQVATGNVAPVYFGSAIVGVGVRELLAGVEEWLTPGRDEGRATRDEERRGGEEARRREEDTRGTVFKIVRRGSGEKVVFVRLVAGCLAVRQRVVVARRDAIGEIEEVEERITGIDRFVAGKTVAAESVEAGEIVGLHGLREARIGDWIGAGSAGVREVEPAFPPPALESVVRPLDASQVTALRAALEQLAEQDPLISLRQRNEEGEISVRLYGEVQKEVLEETLAREYGIRVSFGPSQTICIERVIGTGEHVELMWEGENPYSATLGFRVEAAEARSGIRYERSLGSLLPAFYRATEETVYETLGQGLSGWEVTDCVVTLTHTGYSSVGSVAADFRKLTPVVLMRALDRAGTEVCEPIDTLEMEIPEDTFGAVCGALINARATITTSQPDGGVYRIVCEIPTVELRGVEQQLPGLTRGEGGWESHFAGYVPVSGEPPVRKRIGPDPRNWAQYLAVVGRT